MINSGRPTLGHSPFNNPYRFGSKGSSGPRPEITQFTFPAGSNANNPTPQINDFTMVAAASITKGVVATNTITCVNGSTLNQAAKGSYGADMKSGANINGSDFIYFNEPGVSITYQPNCAMYFIVDSGGAAPGLYDYEFGVDILSTDTATQVAAKVVVELIANGWTTATVISSSIDFQCQQAGSGSFIDSDNGFTCYTNSPGTDGSWFYLENTSAVIYTIDGETFSLDPAEFPDQFEVIVSSTDTSTQVADATATVMDINYWPGAVNVANIVTYNNSQFGTLEATDGDVSTGFTFLNTIGPVNPGRIELNDGDSSYFYFAFDGDNRTFENYLPVNINTGNTAAQVATAFSSMLTTNGFTSSNPSSTVTRVSFKRNASASPTSPVIIAMGATSNSVFQNPSASGYFTFDTPTTDYYCYYSILQGSSYYGINPSVAGRTAVNALITTASSSSNVQANMQSAIPGTLVNKSAVANVMTISNKTNGPVPDAAASSSPAPFSSGFSINVTQQGR